MNTGSLIIKCNSTTNNTLTIITIFIGCKKRSPVLTNFDITKILTWRYININNIIVCFDYAWYS